MAKFSLPKFVKYTLLSFKFWKKINQCFNEVLLFQRPNLLWKLLSPCYGPSSTLTSESLPFLLGFKTNDFCILTLLMRFYCPSIQTCFQNVVLAYSSVSFIIFQFPSLFYGPSSTVTLHSFHIIGRILKQILTLKWFRFNYPCIQNLFANFPYYTSSRENWPLHIPLFRIRVSEN